MHSKRYLQWLQVENCTEGVFFLVIWASVLPVFTGVGECSFEYPLCVESGAAGQTHLSQTGSPCVFLNPSLLVSPTREVEVCLARVNPYQVQDLSITALSYLQPLGDQLGLGLGCVTLECSGYQEVLACASIGCKVWRGVRIGGGLKYLKLGIQGLGETVELGVDLGLCWDLKGVLVLGGYIANLNRPVLGDVLYPKATLGALFRPIEEVAVVCDWVCYPWQKDLKAQYLLGVCLDLYDTLFIRTGLHSETEVFTFGFGLKGSFLRVDYSYLLHPILPGTHQIALRVYMR